MQEKGIKGLADRKQFLIEQMLAVPTWQPAPYWSQLVAGDWASASLDLSLYPNMEVNKVRKQLYNKVVAWGERMRAALGRRGHWADLACPITGNCMFGTARCLSTPSPLPRRPPARVRSALSGAVRPAGERTAHVYNELDGLTMMLGYDSVRPSAADARGPLPALPAAAHPRGCFCARSQRCAPRLYA